MRLRYPVQINKVLYVYKKFLNVRAEKVILTERQAKWFYDILQNKYTNIRPVNNNKLNYTVENGKLILEFGKKGNIEMTVELVSNLKYILSEFLNKDKENIKKIKEILFNPYFWEHSNKGLWYLWSLSHLVNLNICIVSNPGMGKSYLMKNFTEMNKNGRYIDLNTTIAGVLGEVVYDNNTKSWVYNRVVFDDYIFYVDEFNLLKMEVRDALLSLMSGVLLVNKAGVNLEEKIRVSFIVCQNPSTEDRIFKPDLPLKIQVTKIQPLYDRLHFIYPLDIDFDEYYVKLPKVNFFTKLMDIDKIFNTKNAKLSNKIKQMSLLIYIMGLSEKENEFYDFARFLYSNYNKSVRVLQSAYVVTFINSFCFGVNFSLTREILNILLQWKYNETLTYDMIQSSDLSPTKFDMLCEDIYDKGKKNFIGFYKKYNKMVMK